MTDEENKRRQIYTIFGQEKDNFSRGIFKLLDYYKQDVINTKLNWTPFYKKYKLQKLTKQQKTEQTTTQKMK